MRKAPKLTDTERSELQILHSKGYSARSIAKVLGRSPNTIAAELKRNSYGRSGCAPPDKQGTYHAAYAKRRAYQRRKYAKYQGKKITENQALQAFIVEKLTEHWNPDEIAGYLKHHPELGFYASKTAIYEWLYTGPGQPSCQHLPSRRYKPKQRRKHRRQRVLIPNRIGIEQRPEVVHARTRYGDWEGDTLVSGKRTGSKHALVVLQDRTTRLVQARLVPDLTPASFTAATIVSLAGYPIHTLTLDNGIENKQHQAIAAATGATVYFCDPYASWQKGGIENANRMLRRYIPKGSDLRSFSQEQIDDFVSKINNKPRRCLGYRSALELSQKQATKRRSTATEGVLIGG